MPSQDTFVQCLQNRTEWFEYSEYASPSFVLVIFSLIQQILSVSSQAMKHLRSIQVINFGDCLVRPEGAKAIAVSVSEGLPILKVSEGNPLLPALCCKLLLAVGLDNI